jgi:two-component system OmpR family response regulator
MKSALLAKQHFSHTSPTYNAFHAQIIHRMQESAPWKECGLIAAAVQGVNPNLLQDLEKLLNLRSEKLAVKAACEVDDGRLIIVLPGQSLTFSHYMALSAKAFLQDAGVLDGRMLVAGFGSVPAEEAISSIFAQLIGTGSEQTEIIVYPSQSQALKTPTVVMIDPNADLLDFLNVRLSLQGYDVRPAQDGMEGLRLVEAVKPDLVITELALPALDGRQVIQRIRHSQRQSCKIVVLTDLTVEQDICNCFELGAADVMKKPFSPMELEARLRRLLA